MHSPLPSSEEGQLEQVAQERDKLGFETSLKMETPEDLWTVCSSVLLSLTLWKSVPMFK